MEFDTPKTVKEALLLLDRGRGKVRLIAGGTNIIPNLRARAEDPEKVIDLGRIRGLSYVKEEKGKIRIGGLTPIAELVSSPTLQAYASILCQAARQLGNPLLRNRATIAGNLADASPAADTAVPLLALEATVVAEKHGRKAREIPLHQFFVGPQKTVLQKKELIREIYFPKPGPATKTGYLKLGLRNAMAISVISIALLAETAGGKCRKICIGFGAVAPTPIRAWGTEKLLEGNTLDPEVVEAACTRVAQEVSPISDIRASADYRRSMASVLLRRLIRQNLMEGI